MVKALGLLSQSGCTLYQGSLAEARQPFAMMRSPVGTGVKRSGMTKDGDNRPMDSAPSMTYSSRMSDRLTGGHGEILGSHLLEKTGAILPIRSLDTSGTGADQD